MNIMNQKPVKPDDSECCGSGCKPCIFDIYEQKLKEWEKGISNLKESTALNKLKYLPFLITSIEYLSESVKILKFQAINFKKSIGNDFELFDPISESMYDILEECLNIKAGEYLIMKGLNEINGNRTIISRPYTPVLEKSDNIKGVFTIIVSLLVNGKMSQYLKKLKPNDIVFWRGPYLEFEYAINSYKHLLLIGGGTGIVPMYNIAKNVVENEDDETLVSLFCCFKTTKHILLRKQIHLLKDYWNFKAKIYVSYNDDSNFKLSYNEFIVYKKIDETVLHEEIMECDPKNILVLISGPNVFNNFVETIVKKFGIINENIHIFSYFVFIINF